MKKQIKKLRRLIEKKMPYHFHNILLNLFFFIFVTMIISVIILNFIKVEPIAFDENNTFKYTYIEVDQVQKLDNQYYVADDGTYIYLYYSEEPLSSTTKLTGVPRLVNEDTLEKLIPTFQKYYPNLKVSDINEMIKYTGNYYFDHSVAPLLYDMQIVIVFSCLPLLCWFILLCIKLYYRKTYLYSLKNIILNKELSQFNQEFKSPEIIYDSIDVAVLSNYLVFNHPSPYVIDFYDIIWMYTEKKKFFFLFDQDITLVIYDRNFKKTRVLIATSFSSRNKKQIKELMSLMLHISPRTLLGYSQENKRIVNQLKKDKDAL
ncbi:MAG: hypothetical protein RR630_00110 [Coprobacillus sp.]